MLRHKVIPILLPALLFGALIFQVPAKAATDHKDGQMQARWSTTNMFLNSNSYIEQEFILTNTDSLKDGSSFRWTNAYQLGFCWQGVVTISTSGNRCGFVAIELGSKSGNNYYGNLDFAIFNGVDFSILKTNPQNFCDKRSEAGFVDNTMTYYIPCWHPIVVQMNTPYTLRVQYDSSNNASNNNWWSAILTNNKTNETITVGRIKAIANSYQDSLSSLYTHVAYLGEATSCDSVPIIDARVLPVRGSSGSSKYLDYSTSSCVRAFAGNSDEFPGYLSIRLGGEKPESREPGYLTKNLPSPSPTATPISTKESKPTQSVKPSKPASPVFSGIKIVGNTLNINVNLNSSKPDIIYLVSPKLTSGANQKILGNIDGDIATWSIRFDPKSNLGTFPLSFVSVKEGIASDETKVEYAIPSVSSKIIEVSKIPVAPSKITSRVVGTSLIVSAKVVTSGNSATDKVSLYSNVLGIKSSQPLYGDLLKNSVVFSIPVNSSILTKKIDLNLLASNKIGSSPLAKSSYSLPVPKSPAYTSTNQNVATVICTKGQTIRTFASKTCPPGWQTK